MKYLTVVGLFAGSLVLAGCEQEAAIDEAQVNESDSEMVEQVIENVETVDDQAMKAGAADFSSGTQIKRVVSPGGIEAWLVEEHSIPLIAVEIGFKGGARLDPDGKEGLAYMLSGLLDEGAGDLDSQAFQTRLEDLAVRLSFDAGRDGFYGSLRTLTDNRDEAFRLLKLALTEPRFDEEPIERIRSKILVKLNRDAASPQVIARKRWNEEIFGDHPYGRQSQGTPDSVSSITVDDLRSYVASAIARENLKVAVVGDIDADTLARLLDETFGNLPDAPAPAEFEQVEISSDPKLVVVEREQPQSVVLLGGPGLMLDDPDFFPAFVLNYVVGGGGFASRLMEEVREKRGLAYGVSTGLATLDYAGYFIGSVATENARVSESIDIIKSEFEKVRTDGITADELRNAKTYLTGSFPLRFDSNSKIANQLVGYQLVGRGIDYINTRNGKIEAVTLEDVNRVARRFMDPDALTIVVVGQPEGLETAAPIQN